MKAQAREAPALPFYSANTNALRSPKSARTKEFCAVTSATKELDVAIVVSDPPMSRYGRCSNGNRRAARRSAAMSSGYADSPSKAPTNKQNELLSRRRDRSLFGPRVVVSFSPEQDLQKWQDAAGSPIRSARIIPRRSRLNPGLEREHRGRSVTSSSGQAHIHDAPQPPDPKLESSMAS